MSIWARLADATAEVVEGAHISERFHGLLGILAGSHIFQHGSHKLGHHQVVKLIIVGGFPSRGR